MRVLKDALIMLFTGALVAALLTVAIVVLGTMARAQDAYVMPVERWTPHAGPPVYRSPPRIRAIKREVRRAKRQAKRERVRIWAPPVRHVAKVLPIGVPRCSHPVSAVGTEHYNEDEAKSAAIKGWMAEVRHRLGTEAMDINNAVDVSFRCVVSTPGDRISDKIAKWTRNDLLKECRIVATPCRPEVDHELPMGVKR